MSPVVADPSDSARRERDLMEAARRQAQGASAAEEAATAAHAPRSAESAANRPTQASPGPGPCAAGEMPPDRFPGYEVLRELSRGGQGIVFLAMQEGTKRKVALKVLLEGTYAAPRTKRRFEREIELAGHLNHPNIVSVFHSGASEAGRQFYVMDFVDGVSLRQFVREKRLSLEATLGLFGTICDAVQHAHQRGIIHRDLKPSNILVDRDGSPRILDFGLARPLAHQEGMSISLSHEIVGTLPYMAPEQTRGDAELDTRTDIYALGVILYELLTGAYPYQVTGTFMQIMRNIVETPPTPPRSGWQPQAGVQQRSARASRRGGCPIDDEVQTIILRALAKERERRYQSAGELARDIEHYLKGEAIEAKRDSALYVLRKLARRHAAATVVAVAVVVILLSAVAISAGFWWESRAELARRQERDRTIAFEAQQLPEILAGLQPWLLGTFLLEWHAGRAAAAQQIRADARPRSAEALVMDYLLDPQQADDELLAKLGPQAAALGRFAIGERAQHAGRTAEAREHFRAALRLAPSSWLRDRLTARLIDAPTGEPGAAAGGASR